MAKTENVRAFRELYELILFYSEQRDQPAPEGFDFFAELRRCCAELNIDADDLIEEFDLDFHSS